MVREDMRVFIRIAAVSIRHFTFPGKRLFKCENINNPARGNETAKSAHKLK